MVLVEDTISTTTGTAMNNNQPNLMAKLISRKQKQNQSTIKTTAEDNKNVSAAAINNDKKNCKLLKIHQIPSHLRFNKYVLTHYRPTTNFIGCLKSLFYLHNETVNILTHAIPVLGILSAIPWILPWSEINVPYLPTFHVVASVSPWIGSTMYHLFMNHNTGIFAYKLLLTIDLLGIWVTQTAGGLITICATIHCLSLDAQTKILSLYALLCMYCLYKTLTAKCVWSRRFSFTVPFLVRMLMVALRYFELGGGHPEAFNYLLLQDAIAIVGAFIGGTNIPERWCPGSLDLIFNSHHVMHVMVVYAVYQLHLGATLDLQWMTAINQNHEKCTTEQIWWSSYVDSYLLQ